MVLKNTRKKRRHLFTALVFFTLIGCEALKQNDAKVTSQKYSQLDQNNSKDNEFFQALSKKLEKLGSLITVSADTQELNQYREGKRTYPTKCRYTIQPKSNSKVSLEDIKNVNLSVR